VRYKRKWGIILKRILNNWCGYCGLIDMAQPKIQTVTAATVLAIARRTKTKSQVRQRWGVGNPEQLSDEILKNTASWNWLQIFSCCSGTRHSQWHDTAPRYCPWNFFSVKCFDPFYLSFNWNFVASLADQFLLSIRRMQMMVSLIVMLYAGCSTNIAPASRLCVLATILTALRL